MPCLCMKLEGQQTSSGAPKETFGTGSAAQSEAGKKGAEISGTSQRAISACYVFLWVCKGLPIHGQ